MEIPPEIQNKLKCSECDELLSCGPVYLIHGTGDAICGRCSQQPEREEPGPDSETETAEVASKTRNGPYEATASLLVFPCAFASRGCPEKLPFVLGTPPHEANCKFRPIVCPIAPRGSCDWIGSFSGLKEHCDEKHPANVFENPCSLPRPDITQSNLQNYLVSAFSFLFLLQVKVCVASGKLFHSVRMPGDLFDKFSFNLEITGNGLNFVKKGSVLRAGIMALQEPTAICTKINSILDVVDGKYDQTEFRMIIGSSLFFCISCFKNIDFDSQFCDECQRNLVKCKFGTKGCLFVDLNQKKCKKHENRFCKYQTKCFLCDVNFDGGSFIEHLTSSTSCCENTIKANLNSVIRVGKTTSNWNSIILSSNNFETNICLYSLSDSSFILNLFSPLAFYELKKLKCSIEITDPRTKHTEIQTPQIEENDNYDWFINVKMNNFPSSKDIGVDIKINLNK